MAIAADVTMTAVLVYFGVELAPYLIRSWKARHQALSNFPPALLREPENSRRCNKVYRKFNY